MSAHALTRADIECTCRFARVGAHHDELLRVATDVTMALEFVELALTWPELDYSEAAVIPPTDWLEFADHHRWSDPNMAYRLFSAARDIALRSVLT